MNIPGVKPGDLVLDGPTPAKDPDPRSNLPCGTIRRSRSSTPSFNLPGAVIAVVHRSDASGTGRSSSPITFRRPSPEWKDKVGFATGGVDWPVGIGAKGSEGVTGNTVQTSGAVVSVEYAYAKQNNLNYAKMINQPRARPWRRPMEAFQAAAAGADWTSAPGFPRHHDKRRRATSLGRLPARRSS